MRRVWLYVGAAAIILMGVAAFLWFSAPRLESFTPQDSALDVSAGSAVRLAFNRPMDEASVLERLTIEPLLPGSFTWESSTLVFTPDQPWPAGLVVQVRLESGARSKSWLSLPILDDATWTFFVRQPRLAYLYPATGAANIYVFDPRTRTSQQLTNYSSGVLEFDANQTGTSLYFSLGNSQGGSDLYQLDLTGETLEPFKLLDCGPAQCRAPHVSPQADMLAFEKTGTPADDLPDYPQVWIMPLVGQGEPDQVGEALHQAILPDWSPNGVLTFYDTSQQAYFFLDPTSGEQTTFPNQTGQPGSWDPGGQYYVAPEIYFDTQANPNAEDDLQSLASSHLIRFSLEDGTMFDLSQANNLEDSGPAFAPDGITLAFARKFLDIGSWTPGRQLWLMSADGSQARPLTDDPDYNHFDFAWNPAGQQLAFVRFDQTLLTGLPEIWLIDPGSGQQTELVKGGFAPHWIP
jgi:Tol biopolymer transport system component